ncbi:unnamed protein product, partial [Didymodactylos carnosus]
TSKEQWETRPEHRPGQRLNNVHTQLDSDNENNSDGCYEIDFVRPTSTASRALPSTGYSRVQQLRDGDNRESRYLQQSDDSQQTPQYKNQQRPVQVQETRDDNDSDSTYPQQSRVFRNQNRPFHGGNRGRSNGRGRGRGYYNNNNYYPPELPVFYDYVPRQYQIPFQQQQQNNYAQPTLGYPTATKRNIMSNSFQDRQISNNTATNNNSNVQNQQYNTNKQKKFRQNKVSSRSYNDPNLVYQNNTHRTTNVVPSRQCQDGYSSDQQFQGKRHIPRPPTTLNQFESDINLVRNKNQLQTRDNQYEDMWSNTIEEQTPMYFEQINQNLAKTPKYLKPAVP